MKSYVSLSLSFAACDKFDRSMTLGKLLDNNAQLFIFISWIMGIPMAQSVLYSYNVADLFLFCYEWDLCQTFTHRNNTTL